MKMKWGKEFRALSNEEKLAQTDAMMPWLKRIGLALILLVALIAFFTRNRGGCPEGVSEDICREARQAASHQEHLDEKREFNDKVYGTPEMRQEDAARKAAEDRYTHAPEK
jgi:hypothetical protein